jgi:hypothetical protein
VARWHWFGRASPPFSVVTPHHRRACTLPAVAARGTKAGRSTAASCLRQPTLHALKVGMTVPRLNIVPPVLPKGNR